MYRQCTNDQRDFTPPTLSNGSSATLIYYAANQPYSGADVVYFKNNDTEELKCYTRKDPNSQNLPYYTNNVTGITGLTSCDECLSACTAQDIIIYMNPAFVNLPGGQSYVATEQFNAMKAGMISLIEGLQDKINQGIVKLGIYKHLKVVLMMEVHLTKVRLLDFLKV